MSYGNQLLEILASIESGGSFAAFGTCQFILPGLLIEGFGEVSFPIMPEQAKSIIREVAQAAPFGKGNQTIIDKKIRSAWEIDAAKISFANKEWKALLKNVLKEIKEELGLVDQKIGASLYKLLIYQKGDFFLPHKDSEKQVGMFGSLVIGLPSQHTGGQLIIRSGGKTKKVNFSTEQDGYRIPYAAFYADCDHEIKPIRSGYRICLVYNLIQKNAISTDLSLQGYDQQVTKIANIFNLAKEETQEWPLAVLLGHQYTPTNFSLVQLKHNDRSRAKILMDACEQSGYLSRLALVTHYQMGDLEGVDYYPSRWSQQYRTDTDVGTMGEIHEEYTELKYWCPESGPGLGELLLRGGEILSLFELGKNAPIEQEEEGFTGNAGMTIEYWYHYGAVIIWPETIHNKILSDINLEAVAIILQSAIEEEPGQINSSNGKANIRDHPI